VSVLTRIFGDPNARALKEVRATVAVITGLEPVYQAKDDAALRSVTRALRDRLAKGELLDALLPDAYAAVREAAKRTLGQRHFDAQLMGGVVLHRTGIAEMRTGEGKTLTATAPLYLNALPGTGAHLITVNDYLAKFQCEWMGAVFSSLGITVGSIQHDAAFRYDEASRSLVPVTRAQAYACDITYGTNNEFGFDYLRDNMVMNNSERVQRELNYAIVDEVDSILVDEARTPLIISAPAEESTSRYHQFADLIRRLVPEVDDNVDEKMRAATLTEVGITKLEQLLGVENLYTTAGLETVHHIEQALRAERLYKLDRDYVVKDGEVIIVDEFTGRMMYGRRYSEGLHQAIEAKEGLTIQRESKTLATVTLQNYFRLYNKLAGMTGTAATEAEEFSKIYGLDVVVIPTHRPMIRKDLADRIYRTEAAKFAAVVAEVAERNKAGQPVLVGTISIEKNEYLSQLLTESGVPHQILNAKNHEREAEIIAEAGRTGAVTLATNMAGRGVDIILGGSAPRLTDGVETAAAKIAWEEAHQAVVESGGLFVIGTERHEARRIDNQLRGRAGRQGDPGCSQFYVSLEDDLMRIFSSERIKRLMERLGVPDEMPIENRIVSKALESAQHRVEGHNFDIRKHLVEYDDVINKHRETIYRQRRKVLDQFERDLASSTDELSETILEMVADEVGTVVSFHTSVGSTSSDGKEICEVLRTIYPMSRAVEERVRSYFKKDSEHLGSPAEERTMLIDAIMVDARQAYAQVRERVIEATKEPNVFLSAERGLLLRAIDTLWIEHLEAIDHLRQGIGLRGYGQRDPLVEYKREAYTLFTGLLEYIRRQVVYSIYKMTVAIESAPASLLANRNITLSAPAKVMGEGNSSNTSALISEPKIGRNDPCHCGSGKKFKKCHGA